MHFLIFHFVNATSSSPKFHINASNGLLYIKCIDTEIMENLNKKQKTWSFLWRFILLFFSRFTYERFLNIISFYHHHYHPSVDAFSLLLLCNSISFIIPLFLYKVSSYLASMLLFLSELQYKTLSVRHFSH
jgi:hypothetical protein